MSAQQEVSELYAVVDLSKKKVRDKSSTSLNVEEASNPYAELEPPEIPEREQERSLEENTENQTESAILATEEEHLDFPVHTTVTNVSNVSRLKVALALALSLTAVILVIAVTIALVFAFIEIVALKMALDSYGNCCTDNLSSLPVVNYRNQNCSQQNFNDINTTVYSNYEQLQNELQGLNESLYQLYIKEISRLNVKTERKLQSLNESVKETLQTQAQNWNQNLGKIHTEFQQTSANTTNVIMEQSNEIHQLLAAILNPSTSCTDIMNNFPNSATGYYTVFSFSGQLRRVHCDMTRRCGNTTGGWMRVGHLDPAHCPPGFRPQYYNANMVQTCVAISDGCTSINYSTHNISYSKICGQIRGYQIGTPDGFHHSQTSHVPLSLADNYLDGISISSNSSHIWSLGAGCSCNSYRPEFVGNDWICNMNTRGCNRDSLCSPPLWSMQRCGEDTQWFFKKLPSPFSADIEVRVCRDQNSYFEDLAMATIELYVQ